MKQRVSSTSGSWPKIASKRLVLFFAISFAPTTLCAEGDWELTPSSEAALARGLDWLAREQGPEGNWG